MATPKVVTWVMTHSGGLINTEKQAQYVLLGFVVVALVGSMILFFNGGTHIPPEALENPEYGLPEPD